MQGLRCLILCGGKSSRMGRDKGLISEDGLPWAKVIEQEFLKMGIPAMLSIREEQRETYSHHFHPDQLISDNQFENINGPLRGILTVHQMRPSEHWFVIPCDLKDVSIALIDHILFQFHQVKANFFIPRSDGFFHPLCAIYTSEGLHTLLEDYLSRKLKNQSMISILLNRNAVLLDVPEDLAPALANYNSEEDLKFYATKSSKGKM